jgi:hypothetical protein
MAKTTPAAAAAKAKPAPAQKAAAKVAEGHHRFFVSNGHVLTRLDDLTAELGSIDEAAFSHHVSAEKNDFAQWVQDVLGDKALAGKLKKAATREKMLAALKPGK